MRSLAVLVAINVVLTSAGCVDESVPSVAGPSRAGSNGSTSGGAPRVKLEAAVSGRTGTCPAIRFTLGGISVETTASTQFELACDRVVDGAAVEVDAPRMTGGVLAAREVDFGDDALRSPDFEAEGPIEAITQAEDCSSVAGRSVTVLGLQFTVGSFTEVRDIANGCSGLTAASRVRARGRLTNPPAAPVFPLRATRIEPR